MNKVNISVSFLNNQNVSHLNERNWRMAERKKGEYNGPYDRNEDDGFYLHIEKEEVTFWNGKTRVYSPFFGAFFDSSMVKQPKEIMKKMLESKQFADTYQMMPAGVFSSIEQFVDLIGPIVLSKYFDIKTTLSLFLCGDFKDGKVCNLSVSNYFTANMLSGRGGNSHVMCYYLKETEDSCEFNKVLSKVAESNKELFNYYAKNIQKY